MLLSTKEERNFTTKFGGESYTLTSSPTEFPDNVGNHLKRLFGSYLNIDEPPTPVQEVTQEIEVVTEEIAPVEKAKRKVKRKRK